MADFARHVQHENTPRHRANDGIYSTDPPFLRRDSTSGGYLIRFLFFVASSGSAFECSIDQSIRDRECDDVADEDSHAAPHSADDREAP
jgi:hypothetical protein